MNRGRSGIGGRAASDGSNAYRYDYEFEPDVGEFYIPAEKIEKKQIYVCILGLFMLE